MIHKTWFVVAALVLSPAAARAQTAATADARTQTAAGDRGVRRRKGFRRRTAERTLSSWRR